MGKKLECNCVFHRYEIFHIIKRGNKYEARTNSQGESQKMEDEIDHNLYSWRDIVSMPISHYYHGLEFDSEALGDLWKEHSD